MANRSENVEMERPLPKNLDAERSVLGAVLIDNNALYEAEQTVRADDFSLDQNRRVFSRMLLMVNEKQAVDLVTLIESLRQSGELEAVGGAAYVASLADGIPRVSNVSHYAKIVHDKAQLRNLIHLSHFTGQKALDDSGNPEELLEELDANLTAIRERDAQSKGMVHVAEVIKEAMPVIENAMEHGTIIGTQTGYSDLDKKIAGWIPGDLVILAARPSEGKTALALEFAEKQALMNNGVAIWSLEMSRISLLIRLACKAGHVSGHLLRIGRLSKEEYRKLMDGMALVSTLPIWIDDTPILMAHQVRSRIRSIAQRHNIKLAIVDYLQLVRAKGENRTQEVTNISMNLKAAARELGNASGGTLLALSQLARIRQGKIPQLTDLRESGQIEQDADTVMFIYNDPEREITPGQQEPWTKVIDVAKQRNGPLGGIDMTFFPVTMAFEQAVNEEEYDATREF